MVLKLKTQRAFSTVELLITIGVLAILSGVSVLGVIAVKDSQNFKLDAQMITEAVRFAQGKAQLGDGGIPWGVRFTNNQGGNQTIEIFSGSSYAASTTVETHQLSNTNIFTNPASNFTKTIVFQAITGLPSAGNSIAIKKKSGTGQPYIISVSALGKVNAQQETHMLGYWPFDEGEGEVTYDASGNGITGTLTNFDFSGNSDWQSLGKSGSSLSFDGYDDLVRLLSDINTGNAEWTVSAWMKVGDGDRYPLLSNYDSGPVSNEIGIDSSAIAYHHYDGSWQSEYGSSNVADGTWHFLTWVNHDNQTIDLYVNGSVEAGGVYSALTNNGPVNQIGRSWRDWYTTLESEIDDVRIYNKAFSAEEVQNLYGQY